jgi:DNA replication protein DnaC
MNQMDEPVEIDRPRISYGRETRKVTKKDLVRVNIGRVFWLSRSDKIQDQVIRGKVMRYRENFDEMVRTASGVVFTGSAGVGKTSAAVCLLKQAIARGYTSYFVTHDELREIQFDNGRLFGNGSDGVTVKQKIDRAEFLVLDDFNASSLTDKAFTTLHLERLLVRRSSAMLTTVLTTRVAATLKEKQHEDLFEVIKGCMAPMQIEGKNLRDNASRDLMKRVHGE